MDDSPLTTRPSGLPAGLPLGGGLWQKRRHGVLLGTLLVASLLHTAWTIFRWGRPQDAVWYSDLHYLLVVGLSWALSVVALRWAVPEARPGLRALTLALGLYAVGEGLWTYLELFTRTPPFPSLADAFYLAQYPALIAALLHFSRFRLRRLETARILLDGLVVTTVMSMFAWKGLLAGIAGDPDLGLLERACSLAYPVVDLAVLGVLMLLALRGRLLRLQEGLFAAGLSLLVVADLAYTFLEAQDAYHSGSWVDPLWSWAFVLLAVGGLVASRTPTQASEPADPSGLPAYIVLYLPYVAIASTGLFLLELIWDASLLDQGLEIGILAVFVLVTVRQGLVLSDNRQLNHNLERASMQLQTAQALLLHQADHDPLTGLRNRNGFNEQLQRVLDEAAHTGTQVGVLFIDLDRMKQVNDAYGHPTGDAVLREMAARLRTQVRQSDTVARVGGDEFVILMPLVRDGQGAAHLADRLIAAVAEPVVLQAQAMYLTASIGVAFGPHDSPTPEGLIQAADIAMYQAKQSGKSQWRFFDDRARQTTVHQLQLEAQLRTALDRGDLNLHYQPLRRLQDGKTVGFEALLRWTSPTRGPVSPAELIPLAEERGLIVPLGLCVLNGAARQVKRWRREQQADLYVCVNISALHFAQPDFPQQVQQVLEAHRLPGEALVVELTESAFLKDLDAAIGKLAALARLGVRVALDDFGTGYSSLSYLRQLPVWMVKIDRSFVRALNDDGDAFIQAITTLAHRLGLTVVAEGIEEEWQRVHVLALGSDIGQGYGLGRPMPASDVARWLEEPSVTLNA
ncbi:putative bifunctional diguanylate cyclase/phosphodiesterase [Deinococcus phoenicis]|uniref:putative bifunctional diguanylate cyclase/phosphodiesterase n=1 Tax=Deinococcus phoenicis TaxID=1476583 RepID=UPI000555D3AC|nr:EAL domain-containing protein [Deinococcus phoenicis]